jgi:hypothetical protein
MFEPSFDHLPLVPEAILRAHKVHEACDTRFRAAARLKQALYREERGMPIGYHKPPEGRPRKLGSRLSRFCAAAGGNFLSQEIARLVRREQCYREIGAFIDDDRLWSNMLSSMPLTFNLFGALKLEPELAGKVFRELFPGIIDTVTGIAFEHSPGRREARFTNDGSAFDVLIRGKTAEGKRSFVAVEVKYSESMTEPLADHRPRYDELSDASGLYRDGAAGALRANPLQQLWREHMLAQSMVMHGLYETGLFVVIAPALNSHVQAGAALYADHLRSDGDGIGFRSIALEDVLTVVGAQGAEELEAELRDRYCDFEPVHALI